MNTTDTNNMRNNNRMEGTGMATDMITPQYIVDGCNAASNGMKVCPRQAVYAVLVALSGKHYFGANWIENDGITVCPRQKGEDYTKCKTECNQPFHAEMSAIWHCVDAGDDPVGGEVYITGHKGCCRGCRAGMTKEGIVFAMSIDTNRGYVMCMDERDLEHPW